MHIVALIKQVPDTEKVKFDTGNGSIDQSAAPMEINPFDLNVLEAAAQIKEKVGGTVTAISMAPSSAERTLKDSLAKGADRMILLADSKFDNADTCATSYALASAIRKLGDVDMIISGEKAVDVETGQIGPAVAEHLSLPQLTYVSEITEVSEEKISVISEMGGRTYMMESRFPVLMTVTKDINKPRLPTLQDKLKARKAKAGIWSAEDLADVADAAKLGLTGSHCTVVKLSVPPERERKSEVFRGDEAAAKLASALDKEGVLGR
ncbi:MAG: electron transfer flavoprotein subunit beta/FixA family protein [Chloroflexota bacterium]|nr:electron transfer flavoprotein subunit beta/FixA family protein [Chloroflexota bacterium]